jgi:hypothetical protein
MAFLRPSHTFETRDARLADAAAVRRHCCIGAANIRTDIIVRELLGMENEGDLSTIAQLREIDKIRGTLDISVSTHVIPYLSA